MTTTFQDVSFGTILMNGNHANDYLIGEIIMWPNNHNLPDNFLNCDGSTISSSTYGDLFNVIGTKYGGDSNDFKLPNLNNYHYVRGITNMSGQSTTGVFTYTSNTFGNNKISSNQVPIHRHNISNNLGSIICNVSNINDAITRNYFGINTDVKRGNRTEPVPNNFTQNDGVGSFITPLKSHRHNIYYNDIAEPIQSNSNAELQDDVEVTYGVTLANNINGQLHYQADHSKVYYIICASK